MLWVACNSMSRPYMTQISHLSCRNNWHRASQMESALRTLYASISVTTRRMRQLARYFTLPFIFCHHSPGWHARGAQKVVYLALVILSQSEPLMLRSAGSDCVSRHHDFCCYGSLHPAIINICREALLLHVNFKLRPACSLARGLQPCRLHGLLG